MEKRKKKKRKTQRERKVAPRARRQTTGPAKSGAGVGGPLDGVGITRVWKCFAISKSGMCLLVCAKARYRKPPTGGLADSTGVRKSGLRFRRVTRIKNARRTRARARIRTWRVLPRPFFSLFTSQTNKSTYVFLICFFLSFSLYRPIAHVIHPFLSFGPFYTPASRLRTICWKKNNTD